MIKENLVSKNSFTLFEVILSLFILSAALGSVGKLFVDEHGYEEYNLLLLMENEFAENDKVTDSENIKFR